MSTPGLPPVDPGFAAEILANLPPRLARKLDAQDPADWVVTGSDGPAAGLVTVVVGQATVTISGPGEASCDCLLAPKCLHLAAVLAACPVVGVDKPSHTGSTVPDDQTSRLPTAALEAVDLAEDTLDTLITSGLTAVTTPDWARVLRTVALSRVHSLHRLAAAFATLHTRLATPTTEAAVLALAECAAVTWELAHAQATGSITEDHLGTARRRYAPVGTLRLRGLACEPVVTDSGYAGVVTHLADDSGRTWTLNSVAPGDVGTTRAAYRGGTGLPEVSAPHREIARAGLLLTRATASADGRLGKGSGVRASVREPSSEEPWPDLPGWWCGEAVITGLQAGPTALRLRLETADGLKFAAFTPAAWRLDAEAVRLVGGCAGTTIEVRMHKGRLLAIRSSAWSGGPAGEGVAEKQPHTWWFPGLDRISRDTLGTSYVGPPTVWPAPAGLDPATVLTRWRDRVARQGRRAVTGAGLAGLERDRRWLESVASPARARQLEKMAEAGARGERRFDGSFAADPRAMRPAWTAVALACRD
ncbi:MAG TPA: hypothetical protein GXZ30_15040 [Propionibacterium sp.]|nr:hypothetical protein [Propionibacterium sp.]